MSVGEENKTFFIRAWKPLHSRHESLKRTISASGEFGLLRYFYY